MRWSAMKPQPEPSTQEVLTGLVERVTYHNEENGFCVLRIKARGHRDLVTVIGHAAVISAGEWVTASGEWINDRTHGQQYRAKFLKTSEPTSLDGIEKYLGSGMIRGIGPVYAKKLVRAFGEKVFDTIEAEPERLREVTGIGPLRADRITAAWAEQKVVREIMVFLHSHGVGTARAVRIYKTYGSDAVQVMTENPYRLARDIRGIGFKTADAIAMRLGIEKAAMIRVRAGISYALTEAMDEGHCGLPTEELIPLAEKLLEVPTEITRTALDLELQEGTVVADRVAETPCVFLAALHRAERIIAERLMLLANGTLPWPWIDPDKALPWVEKRIGLDLAESQVAAIRLALMSKVLVMTGGPGVGKTTIVKAILRMLAAKGVGLLLCAPTGRAAKRMTEATGFEAKTFTANDPEVQTRIATFQEALQQLGWMDGRNLRIDIRWAAGDPDRIRRYAAELVALAPDVILASGSAAVGALLQATRAVPIIFVLVPDPVGAGYVASLAQPGGNATGFTPFEYGIGAKWLELLKQIAPRLTRVAVLRDPAITAGIGQLGAIQAAAPSFGVELSPIDVRDASEIERAVSAFARTSNGGLILLSSTTGIVHRELIIALAARHRLPAVYFTRFFVTGGGLISYGADTIDVHRLAAGYVDRILKGEKPADLPVQASTKLKLVINLKTAKALGIDIPTTLLATADEVIE